MTRLTAPISEADHVVGAREASVSLVEYGDYECPYCGLAHSIVREVVERMGSDLVYAFRHFPLANMHPHAQRAAEAAEAAAAQGAFWEMHDSLYAQQEALGDRDLLRRAQLFRLDVDRFTDELARGVHRARVRRDFLTGVRSGVNGTPTFFINGVRHDGPWDLDALLEALESAEHRV